jgi:hypothetical protein
MNGKTKINKGGEVKKAKYKKDAGGLCTDMWTPRLSIKCVESIIGLDFFITIRARNVIRLDSFTRDRR